MATHALTAEDGMAKAWFLDENGNLTGGAEAINQAMRFCWWAKPLTYLYYLSGIRQLQDWLYQWVADNRYRLPGSTSSCKIDLDKQP
jgi:predicted DCC family thiol-disulfide oxidoreductase YuxK